ncbi:MAG: DUF4135 domain-containing protein [Erysipelotrichaceae bacterium]
MEKEKLNLLFREIIINSHMERVSVLSEELSTNLINNMKDYIYTLTIESIVDYYLDLVNKNIIVEKTKNERLTKFYSLINLKKHITEFYDRYTTLKEKTIDKVNDRIKLYINIANRSFQDQYDINRIFKINKSVSNIIASEGDLHNGMSVSKVYFGEDFLYYKPHSLLAEELLQEVSSIITSDLNIEDMKFSKRISRDSYSWQGNIEHLNCICESEVDEYYFKSGIYLAIFFCFGSSDLHFENLIANGKHPIFIDLETLISANNNRNSKDDTLFSFESSVLNTALLPVKDKTADVDIFLSGLFSSQNISKKMSSNVLIEDDLLDYKYEKQFYELKNMNNIVKINDSMVEIDSVKNLLIDGFRRGMKSIQTNTKEIIDIINLDKYSKLINRKILRPTRVYFKFLQALNSPAVYCDQNLEEEILNILYDKFNRSQFGYLRTEKEVYDLKKGNIPLFYTLFNSKDLFCNDEIICNDYFINSPKADVINRIYKIDDFLIDYQIRLIEMSLMQIDCKFKNIDRLESAKKYWNKSELQKKVIDDFDTFIKFIYIDNIEVSKFLCLELVDNNYEINYNSLDSRNSGAIVLSLIHLGKFVNKKYLEVASKIIEYYTINYKLLKKPFVFINYNCTNGNGFLIYLLVLLYQITRNQYYINEARVIMDDLLVALRNGSNENERKVFITDLVILVSNISEIDESFANYKKILNQFYMEQMNLDEILPIDIFYLICYEEKLSNQYQDSIQHRIETYLYDTEQKEYLETSYYVNMLYILKSTVFIDDSVFARLVCHRIQNIAENYKTDNKNNFFRISLLQILNDLYYSNLKTFFNENNMKVEFDPYYCLTSLISGFLSVDYTIISSIYKIPLMTTFELFKEVIDEK